MGEALRRQAIVERQEGGTHKLTKHRIISASACSARCVCMWLWVFTCEWRMELELTKYTTKWLCYEISSTWSDFHCRSWVEKKNPEVPVRDYQFHKHGYQLSLLTLLQVLFLLFILIQITQYNLLLTRLWPQDKFPWWCCQIKNCPPMKTLITDSNYPIYLKLWMLFKGNYILLHCTQHFFWRLWSQYNLINPIKLTAV